MSKKLIPELRFPEFEGVGEWVEEKLGERGEFVGGGTPSKSNIEFWEGEFPWVSSSDIAEDSIHQINITRFITAGALKESATKIVPANSLLIVSRVGVGKVAVSKEEISTSQDFLNFTPQKDDPVFLGYYLKSNQNLLLSFSQGMAIKGFTKVDISRLSLRFPPKEEQQKIAACLSSLDELIAAHTDKLNALKDHKKGLMQNLFPQEGETVPKLRFPEFEGDGEWVIVQLHQILSESRLGGNYRNGVNENGKPLIKMGNISRGSIDISTLSFTSKEEELNSEDVLSYGDLLFNTRNTLELVGKVAIWRNELDKAFYNSNIMKLIFNTDLISSNFFMNYLLNTELMIKKIRSIATGTTSVAAVYTKDLLNLELPICRLQEQQEIASCLSAVDELITAQQEKINQLQQHKKGLMQGLFPNPSAISN